MNWSGPIVVSRRKRSLRNLPIYQQNLISYFRKHKDFQLTPILVGSLDSSKLEKYGQLLAPYLCDPKNLFVVSSDFCHWGR